MERREPESTRRNDVKASSRRLGDYELIGELARGGMGRVLLARRVGQLGFERLFAIKVLHEGMVDEPDARSMLIDEANIASRLHHPNVVPIIDLGTYGTDGFFLVMEYVGGPSLYHMLRAHPEDRPPGVIVAIVLDALRGLHAAHELTDSSGRPANLVHRDFTPQNLLLELDGTCRVTDFGIAKVSARITHTRAGIHKGRLAFMAPEQMAAARDIDRRVDIWSAGLVLMYALGGEHPFKGESEAETISNILRKDIPRPSATGLRPPSCFDEVCLKALERRRDRRFRTALEMADALHSAALAEGLLAPPSEVARWVTSTFADDFAARREAIQALVGGTGSGSLPVLPRPAAPLSHTGSSPLSAVRITALPSGADLVGATDMGEDDAASDLKKWARALAPSPPSPATSEEGRQSSKSGIPLLESDDVELELEEDEDLPAPAPAPRREAQARRSLHLRLALVIAIVVAALLGFAAAVSLGGHIRPGQGRTSLASLGGEAAESDAAPSPARDDPPAEIHAKADATPTPAPAPADTGETATETGAPVGRVQVVLRGVPDDARVRLDGHIVGQTTLSLPRDGVEHVIRVDREGYRQWSHKMVPSEDLTLDVRVDIRAESRSGPTKGEAGEAIVRDPGF